MTRLVTLTKMLLVFALLVNWQTTSFAQKIIDSNERQQQEIIHFLDSVNTSINYQHGVVELKDIARLNIPENYKFIPADKARMIVEDFWGNPKDETVLGMIVKSAFSIADTTGSWAFVVSYDESGYVKDEDADDIDYAQMLKDIQEGEEETNKQRVEAGYPTMHLLDWAATPYYDKDRKILHWAKKLKFGNDAATESELTLNYDVRVLGRKGVLSMNAVGTMGQLDDINKHIPDVLSIAEFKKGSAYSDFNPSVDKVAAYTIGGLVAGKLLAKTGLFILLLKNIKLILFGLLAFLGAFRNRIAGFFTRKKNKPTSVPSQDFTNHQEDVPELAANTVDATGDKEASSETKEQA